MCTAATPGLCQNVLTAQYDTFRTSWNAAETQLTLSNVNQAQFGKLFTRQLDGWVYAQPLFLQGLTIPGHGPVNVVFVCSANNTVYAFDADNASVAAPYWSTNLGSADTTPNAPGSPNSEPVLGIISTPVIVPAMNAIYVAAATRESGHRVYRLHALDITTGQEKFGGPVIISGQLPGNASDAVNGTVAFNPDFHLIRAALAATTDTVYIAMTGSHDIYPFHGWVFGYSLSNLQQTGLLLLTANGQGAGVWQSVRAPVVDGGGNLFIETGNGDYDGVSNFGSSILKLSQSRSLTIADWFTPYNWQYLTDNDLDLASAGPLLIPGTTYLVGSGKTGVVYVLDTSNMGRIQDGNSQIVQAFHGSPNNCTAGFCYEVHNLAFWNNPSAKLLYLWAYGDVLRVYQWTGSQFVTTPVATGSAASNYPGGYLSGSSNGNTAGTGILWALSGDDGSESGNGLQFGTLRAYDASNATTEIWNSDLNSARDSAGYFAKFVPPVVASGKVFVGNFSNQLVVYGLLNSSLSISKSHSGDFIQGQTGAIYTVTVTDAAAAGPASGTVTVTESLPDGMTLVSMAGNGWTCPGTAPNNCTRNDQLAAGTSYPALTVTVNVAARATSPQINGVAVSGGNGPAATSNDSTNIRAAVPVPDVVGSTQSAATTAIQNANLVVGQVSTASSNSVPSGRVVSESPAAGTAVTLGSAVNLVVSSGPTLVSITVTPANPSIVVGTAQQFQATGTYSDSSTQNLTSRVNWASATTAVATIAGSGKAAGTKVGASIISATLGSISGSTTLVVTPLGPCDVTQQGVYAVVDVQALINQALGGSQATNDLNSDGVVNIAEIQIVINAVLNLGCKV